MNLTRKTIKYKCIYPMRHHNKNMNFISNITATDTKLLKILNPRLTASCMTSFDVLTLHRDRNVLQVNFNCRNINHSINTVYNVRLDQLTKCALTGSTMFKIENVRLLVDGMSKEPTKRHIYALKLLLVRHEQDYLQRKSRMG